MISFVSSVSIIYSWIVICIHLFFLYAIARFYQEKSGQRSYYRFFLIPIGLFAASAVIYSFPEPNIAGDFWGDLTRFIGGIVLGGAGYFLLRLMVGGRT